MGYDLKLIAGNGNRELAEEIARRLGQDLVKAEVEQINSFFPMVEPAMSGVNVLRWGDSSGAQGEYQRN